ncbi:hypothetical protein HOE425_20002 [Hoeflea sp. EC-HK425]|nr:hypothetical protein HOE425_20002 [Hoeflea sp. EC-HK425]
MRQSAVPHCTTFQEPAVFAKVAQWSEPHALDALDLWRSRTGAEGRLVEW